MFMDASLDYCKANKPKLYIKAEREEIENLPGIDLEFEAPTNANMAFNPEENESNLDKILSYLANKHIYPMD